MPRAWPRLFLVCTKLHSNDSSRSVIKHTVRRGPSFTSYLIHTPLLELLGWWHTLLMPAVGLPKWGLFEPIMSDEIWKMTKIITTDHPYTTHDGHPFTTTAAVRPPHAQHKQKNFWLLCKGYALTDDWRRVGPFEVHIRFKNVITSLIELKSIL